MVGRILQRKRTLLICIVAGIGGVSPDWGHFLNIVTRGKVDWSMFHGLTNLFAWLSVTSICGLVAIAIWSRLVLGRSK